jgi:hypothetical protein
MRCFFTAACATILCGVAASSQVGASPLVFHIDPVQSQLSLTLEDQDGTPLSSAQTPGSDTTSMSGTVDMDVTGSTLQFLTTSDTQFALQTLPQAPLSSGAAGTAPAQFGLNLLVPDIASGVVSARDYVADATSGVIPLTGNSFDATQVLVNLTTGITAYNLIVLGTPYIGKFDLSLPAPNQVGGGTLALAGDVYTLTLPVLAAYPATVGGVTVLTAYSGQLVATAVVPEPGTLALAVIGSAALFCCGRSRWAPL